MERPPVAKTDTSMAMGWQHVVDAVLPLELTLDQLPKHLTAGPQHDAFDYKPIFVGAGARASTVATLALLSRKAAPANTSKERTMWP